VQKNITIFQQLYTLDEAIVLVGPEAFDGAREVT